MSTSKKYTSSSSSKRLTRKKFNHVKPFLFNMFLSIQNDIQDNTKLLNKLIHLDNVQLKNIQEIKELLLNVYKVEVDDKFILANIYFLIFVHNNKSFQKFVKSYYKNFNIQSHINEILSKVFSTSSVSILPSHGKTLGGTKLDWNIVFSIASFALFVYNGMLFQHVNRMIYNTYSKSDVQTIFQKGNELLHCKSNNETAPFGEQMKMFFFKFMSKDFDLYVLDKALFELQGCLFESKFEDQQTLFANADHVPTSQDPIFTRPKALPVASSEKDNDIEETNIHQKTWINKFDYLKQLVPYNQMNQVVPANAENTNHKLLTYLYDNKRDIFDHMTSVLQKDLQETSLDPGQKIAYLEKYKDIPLEHFKKKFFTPKVQDELESIFYNIYYHIKDNKSIYDYFFKEGYDYLILGLAGGNIFHVLYSEFQRTLNIQIRNYEITMSYISHKQKNLTIDINEIISHVRTNMNVCYWGILYFCSFLYWNLRIYSNYTQKKLLLENSSQGTEIQNMIVPTKIGKSEKNKLDNGKKTKITRSAKTLKQ